jgi:hypothetical protein
MTACASAARAQLQAAPDEANSALLSGTLQRAVKTALAQYVAQLAQVLRLRQRAVATAVVRLLGEARTTPLPAAR